MVILKSFAGLLLLAGLVAFGFGYMFSPFNARDAAPASEEVVEGASLGAERQAIEMLVRTYLISSMGLNFEILPSLTSGAHRDNLEKKVIPSLRKLSAERGLRYDFNPNSIRTEIDLVGSREAFARVDYVVTKHLDGEKTVSQERVLMFLTKPQSKWLVLSVEAAP